MKPKFLIFLLVQGLFIIVLVACGTLAGNPGTTTTKLNPEDVILPDASSIELTELGKGDAGLMLQDSSCSEDAELGVFGFAFGPVCSGSPLIDNFLYGPNLSRVDDQLISCAQYNPELDDNGILFTLLCSDLFLQGDIFQSIHIDSEFAISFTDFDISDNTDAIGTWTAAGDDDQRYPANIRVWWPDVGADLQGVLAMTLSSRTEGKLYVDFTGFDEPFQSELAYGSPEDTSDCVAEPTVEHCHWQDMSFKGSESFVADGLPSGMRVLVLADAKVNPSFYRIEAKIRYSEDFAKQIFNPEDSSVPVNFDQVRTIYIRAVQKGSELWGSFDFQDENGATIISPLGDIDLARLLRDGFSNNDYAGICQQIGSDELIACEDIDYLDYQDYWLGDTNFEGVAVDYSLPIDFGELPPNGVQMGDDN